LATERVERRLAAVLAADVAGYSRLIGADEERTLARLKAHRRELIDLKISEHRGRIVKTTGDGVLAEFASVVDALRCASEVQTAMTERNAVAGRSPGSSCGRHPSGGHCRSRTATLRRRRQHRGAPRKAWRSRAASACRRAREDAAGRLLDLAFEDIGEQQLKNIAPPMRVFRVRPDLVGEAARYASQPSLALPDKPSVAVLPFTNMSSDPEQEFFSDGIAEDIITALSRYPSLFVIARNSSFTYKGRAVDVKQVGRDLGVRYVLEGSLRKSGNRIRVTAQLVEAEAGKHVWAESYDRDLADIFALQDEITEAVTIAIAPAIADAEQQRAMRKPPGASTPGRPISAGCGM
jgi:adenylate cyclase